MAQHFVCSAEQVGLQAFGAHQRQNSAQRAAALVWYTSKTTDCVRKKHV